MSNATALPEPGSQASTPPPLRHWLRQAAAAFAHQPAIEAPDARLDHAQLEQQVLALSRALREAGIGAGDRVAIAAARSASTIIAILAAVDAGVAYVPLDLAYPAERLAAMLDDAKPRAVLGDADALATLTGLVGPVATLQAPGPRGDRLHGAEDDLTYVLFTSGSTGRPKGVAMGAMPLRHLIAWHAAHPRLGQAARTLQFAPLSFDVHAQEIFSTLACGGTLVLLPEAQRRDPAQLHAALVAHRIERIFVPYVALQMVADASREAVPASLRDVVSAGEQLQITPAIRSMFLRLPGAELHNHYGPTESHVVTAHELRGDASHWPEIPPIGAPLPHVRLAIRDADSGQLLPRAAADTTGELLLGGDTLAHGYLGRPELTAERFRDDLPGLPGRWYVSGDLVRRAADGVCSYLGRADQQLKVDGFRIEPGEIELALMAHEAVKEAVVTAPELPGIGRQLVAHLVLRSPAAPALPALLRSHLRERMPEYMVPVRYVVLDRLPTTPSGKIDRRGLPLPQVEAVQAGADPLLLVRSLWQDLLGQNDFTDEHNLFDLGARSLLVLRFVARLKEQGITSVGVADVYDRPTVAGIAGVLTGASARRGPQPRQAGPAGSTTAGIAIVGMATRTADAPDVAAFWNDLLAGREGIRHFAPHELDPDVPQEVRSRPNFVPARGVLQGAADFDASFFGLSARDATLIDPQQRLLLELSWTALEHAGIDPTRGAQRIGVYAGTANNSYVAALRREQPELVQQAGEFATMLASEKDYAATRVAHRLNLNGPAVSVHTACSTGLVAVAQAWHALASGQCDVALAGGTTVLVPQEGGYLHVEGGMESADGHCRPFDADASGTVFGSGGAVVVLKRLEDAQADGDTIYAVIRGVGVNNDGADKASFTAPSVSGQAGAIRMALDHAGVTARQIGYVEAHGTGTALGDPIEVAALTRAWREDTADTQFCRLGSLKGNLGHTVAAAGVLGLIKAALSLHRGVIPATLHYRRPNPQIDFTATPFQVLGSNTAWPRTAVPRLAAVSSFGVGGTNAHAVLEEAPVPATQPAQDGQHPWLLPLSAKSAPAALQRARELAEHLESHPHLALADVAATLMRGRTPMAHRLAVAARDVAGAVKALRGARTATAAASQPRLVFLFPGQGSQHPGMARGLYEQAPAFREALDRCLAIAQPLLPADLHGWLVTADPGDAEAAALLAQTRHAQPALFSMSYALAAWLDSLGVRPDAFIGHSIGELAAACRADVMSLEDAMVMVVARGQAMFEQAPGAMLAVRAGADVVAKRLPPGVEIASLNAPQLTVVAGPQAAIDAFAQALEADELGTTRLKVSHAFHSAAMDAALPRIQAAVARARLQPPRLPVYSCVSGAPLQPHEATDPAYWARQVRAPVRFSAAVQAELAGSRDTVFVEVGPGQALTALLRQHRTARNTVPTIVPLLGAANTPGDAALHAVDAVGALWCAGVSLAWPVAASARRVPLPTYPFQRERHWFARRISTTAAAHVAAAPHASLPAAARAPEVAPAMSRLPRLAQELQRLLGDVSGVAPEDIQGDATFVDQGLDSLSMTQAALELDRVFGIKLRFRRLMEDLDTIDRLAAFLDAELPVDRFAPAAPAPASAPEPAPAAVATAAGTLSPSGLPAVAPALQAPALHSGDPLHQLVQQQLSVMSQQLALLSGRPAVAALPVPATVAGAAATPAVAAAAPTPAAATPADPAQPGIKALVDKPFGASARITLDTQQDFTPEQRRWLDDFVARYNARSGQSKRFSQQHRKVMADPRVVTGFNPLWKDLVYPIVADRSKGARLWDLDGNEYIDLLSCFGANLLGYQPDELVNAMVEQLQRGIEVGPQHPMAAEVAQLISEFTGMERVAFCNTGSEAVMGAMRIARTVTGRKTIAIFTNSYHGIFDEVIVRGTKQLRSLSAAPGILANAVENVLVLDWNSEDSLRVLRERGHELAAIMTEPIQNKYPTVQPREFVQSLRRIADEAGCALIFDEVVTGFRVAPGGAQEFYGVRADLATYGKIIGGGLPFAAIGGSSRWLDALDGGHWQYGDDSYPEAGVTYFAGTFVRHPLALVAARASLLHLKRGGRELYRVLNARTQSLIDRLNTAFAVRGAPVKAVHCSSLWRLSWDDGQKYVSLFYYLCRFHGLHLYEQFGHFVTEAMGEAELDRIFQVFTEALDELMALGFIAAREGTPPPSGGRQRPGLSEAPLTPGQTERWLAASFDANARRALNESLCLSLSGPVDTAALTQALADVLARHEAFRVCFDSDEPRQRLAERTPLRVHPVDLRHEADADAALARFCDDASLTDFPLDQAPLARASLLQLSDGRCVVHLVTSHLIFDGWATPVFLADLAEAYRARSIGLAPHWPPAESPLQFGADEWARAEGPQGQAALAHWTRVLANPPAPLALGDRQPPAVRRYAGDTVRARFDAHVLAGLQRTARQHKSTLFQVLLAAVSQMVQRLTQREDFVISIPYASQSLQRHGPLVADGVLDLPLRLRARAGEAFPSVLAFAREQLMDALEQPLATQGSVARALGLPSAGNRPPLTGVFFNLNPRLDVRGFEPLHARVHEGRKLGLLSEVIFNFYELPDGLSLDLHHSTEFFSAERAGELVRQLQAVLDEVVAQVPAVAAAAPALPIPVPVPAPAPAPAPAAQAGPLPAHDLERLARWNATETPYETGLRLGDLIARTVQRQPDAIAVRFEGRAVTYAELDRMAWALAHRLRGLGVKPGDLVGVCLDRSVELVAALVGVVYSGGAYVPVDPAYPRERVAHMCEDARLQVVVTREAECARAGTAFPATAHRVMMDAALLSGPTTSGLVGSPEDPAYVIFTSGSTGRPKGAMNAHKGIVNRLQWMQQEYRLTPEDRVIQKTPYSFDVSVWEFFWPLMTGATIVVARPDGHKDAGYLAQLIADEAVTVLHFVPSMLRLFLEEPRGEQCRSVRQVLCSGEALPLDAVDRFFEVLPHARLGNLYGPTEAAVDVTCWNCVPGDPRRIVPIGRPIANTRMYVLGEQLELLPVGQEGELYIGGVQVGMGYVSRPDLTRERFLPDPFNPGGRMYKTGDVGRWLDDGAIEYLGRADDQVKIRGNRIELGEIEATLLKHPQVAHCVVVARDFGGGDVRLVAYGVARGGWPDAVSLKAHLAASLPEYMLPQHYVQLAEMPLLPNGKINRKALPAPNDPAPTTGAAAPRNELEATLAEVMRGMLKVKALGIDDDFFAMGGHSLLAARVIAQLNKQLGTTLTLRSLFEAPTVARLAAAIEAQRGGGRGAPVRAPIVHRADQRVAPLTLMQERVRFIEEMQPGRVVYNAPSAHRLKGTMDVVAFDKAFTEMVRRQPALRTSIVREGGGWVQRVDDDVSTSLLPLEDLGALPPAEREAVLMQRLESLTAQTFTLSEGPLFRARLFRLADDEHALFFMTHHVIWDGWSFDVLYQEISALYDSYLAGRAPGLPPLPVTYGDFAAWHNEWLQSDELKDQVAYWKSQYAKGAMPRPLAGDFPRELAGQGRGATEWMHLRTEQVEQVREIAMQTGSTLSIVVLSVYAALMSQWLRDPCPAIGMPVRGRSAAELEGVMGFFNNMLPIRLAVDTEASCLDWIRSVRKTMVDGFASQDAPFELLAQELDSGQPGRSTLYQVMYSFQDARARPTGWGPLAHERIPLLQKGATEDVNLWMVEVPGGIEGGVQYNADLLLPATAAALRDRLLAMLADLVRDPTQPVRRLLAIRPEEQVLVDGWSRGDALAVVAAVDPLDTIATRIEAEPDHVALQAGGASLSYRELGVRLARAQAQLGPAVPAGTLAAVAMADPIARIVAALALLRAGAKCVFIDAGTPAAALHKRGVEVVVGADPAGSLTVAAPSAGPSTDTTSDPALPALPVDRRALAALCGALSRDVRLLAGDRVLCIDDGAHGMALVQAVMALAAGAQLQFAPAALAQQPEALARRVRDEPIAMLRLDASAWTGLLDAAGNASLPLVAWLEATESTPQLVQALLQADATVIGHCRPTLVDVPVAAGVLSSARDSGLAGRPLLPGVLRVVDDSGALMPPGVPGALQCVSDGAAASLPLVARWRTDGLLQMLVDGEPALRRPRQRPAGASAPQAPALTPTEQALAEVWRELLGLQEVHAGDNFFELGGTSLLAMQAVARLEQRIGKQVSPRRYVIETLSQLAAAYDAPATPAAAATTEPPKRSGVMRRLARLVQGG
ncbi:non-ribosomal peptide synthetase/type I polyketide synthase [Ideonella sp. BN130291]|uniref:non-ribosomal peptide synthetase/type I polyketide synthase n=1 Tax=Ideonella sp. BN130291 TaxID=3112940 RepID=UPI002E253294|nr:non-ribosomal peptide synthetase/type I polyketide synthase [Ideonella sp. BN130291]MED5621725.1 amino acid adenylation domain-containing protein [Ideonella sp. BN130291]